MRFAVLLAAAAPAALALPADGARPDSTLKPWIPDPSTGLPLQPQPQLSATCQASCYTSEVQDWGEKCKWAKVCAGCNECGVASTASNPTASTASNTQQPQPQPEQPAAPAPGTATTGTSTSEQGKQLSATCQASCYTSEVQDWGEKCKWAKMCAGCNECGVASTASKATASNATANVGANAAAASISFVTSFFVPKDPPDDYNWDHYHEIEAALAANLLNAALDEVCVVYDSVTKDDGCSALAARLGAKVDAVATTAALAAAARARLACTSRTEGQPSYRMMFEYATTLPKGDVVVLGNADSVLDDTTIAQLAARLPTSRMLTIGARRPSGATRASYEALMNHTAQQNGVYPCESSTGGEAVSWDAYMWRKPFGGLPLTHPVWDIMLPHSIVMNSVHAENRAGQALIMANVTNGGMIYNPCKLDPAPLVTFHEAPKMHHGNLDWDQRVDATPNDLQRAIAAGATCRRMAGSRCVPGGSVMCPTVDECTKSGDGAGTPYAGVPVAGS